MRVHLKFTDGAMDRIRETGLRQPQVEKLRWTTDHPASSYGGGVLLRGQSSEILDGAQFQALRAAFGAWIETDNVERVQRALGLPDADGIEAIN